MRTVSRAIVVSALALPLAFAGAGVSMAGGHHHPACVYWSCDHYDGGHNTAGTVWNEELHTQNFGIIG